MRNIYPMLHELNEIEKYIKEYSLDLNSLLGSGRNRSIELTDEEKRILIEKLENSKTTDQLSLTMPLSDDVSRLSAIGSRSS